MSMKTRELLNLRNTGHAGINSLFSKAHSMDWDLDRDVDWDLEIAKDDPLVDPVWSPYGRTETFRSLPEEVRNGVTRQALGRMLNILQVGESVAQDVCARLALICEEEDYRNHAVAQAMDEARHHLAYVRILEKMGDELEDIDPFTEALFDQLLASEDKTFLIATEQFFLESMAMRLFESMVEHARHPLLKRVVTLITRDESRHMAFGVLYIGDYLKRADPEERVGFARQWLPRILQTLDDRPGPRMAERMARRLARAGATDPEDLAQRMRIEQQVFSDADHEEARSGRRVPHLLASARRAGLMAPELLGALELAEHPLIRGALHDRSD